MGKKPRGKSALVFFSVDWVIILVSIDTIMMSFICMAPFEK